MSGRQEVTGSIPVSSTILLLSLLAAACGGTPPDTAVRNYPLEAGTIWIYHRSLAAELVGSAAGSRVVEDTVVAASRGEEFVPSAGMAVALLDLGSGTAADPPFLTQAYSQDADGLLYHPALSGAEDVTALPKPAATAAHAPFRLLADDGPTGEPRLVLSFPLTMGSAWLVRRDPCPVLRRVTARGIVEVPAGRFAAFEVTTFPSCGGDPPYVDWIGEPGLLRRTRDRIVDDLLFPGHPEAERVRERVELVRFIAPSGR